MTGRQPTGKNVIDLTLQERDRIEINERSRRVNFDRAEYRIYGVRAIAGTRAAREIARALTRPLRSR